MVGLAPGVPAWCKDSRAGKSRLEFYFVLAGDMLLVGCEEYLVYFHFRLEMSELGQKALFR